jgi:hypothetical protein
MVGQTIFFTAKNFYSQENRNLRFTDRKTIITAVNNNQGINHTKIPITASKTNFVHCIIAGVNYNINFAGVGSKKIIIIEETNLNSDKWVHQGTTHPKHLWSL